VDGAALANVCRLKEDAAMLGVKRILLVSVAIVLIGCLVGGALARGGHGGGGFGGGPGGGGGMRASGMYSGGQSSGMRNGGMSSAMARNNRTFSSGHMDSNQMAFRSGDMGRRGDYGRQTSFRSGDNVARAGDWSRGDHPHNANYDRLMAFMNDRGGDRDGNRGNALGNNWGDNRGGVNARFASGDNRFDRNGDNFDRDNFRHNADSIRRDFRDRHDVPFRTGWWDHHHFDRDRFDHGFGPWAFNWWWDRPWYWWGWSTAPYLDSWLGFGWSQPCYWDYGPNGYANYNYGPSLGYQTNLPSPSDEALPQPQAPVAPNYKQAYDLAHSGPAVDAKNAAQSDWLPLGVFAVTKPGKQEENWMVQLGVNKQGVLSGTYYNQEKDSAHPLVGMVDQKTHKAAWYFADGTENPMVFETSVDNLTEPQTTVMVHFAPGDSGVWQMVRLERPEAAQNQGQQGQQGQEALPTPPQHELP
jgi:hypothetical protein